MRRCVSCLHGIGWELLDDAIEPLGFKMVDPPGVLATTPQLRPKETARVLQEAGVEVSSWPLFDSVTRAPETEASHLVAEPTPDVASALDHAG